MQANYKPYAFSQFAKALTHSPELGTLVPWDTCTKCNRSTIDYMGFSVRTDEWRYTEWKEWDKQAIGPVWNSTEGVELYV